ncbi:MAG: CBS domain-containing protein [Actinomycetota bacterium]|nr:CBS domain-containing protein [Actinomycetota bacterium]
MTPNPLTLSISATLVDAARVMRDADVGPVVVLYEDGSLCGLVTDRDLVVRGLAEGFLPHSMLEDVCSKEPITVGPDDDVTLAVQLMREHAVRRLIVAEQDRVVGIVSLGDVAMNRDPDSVLADISSAPAQR